MELSKKNNMDWLNMNRLAFKQNIDLIVEHTQNKKTKKPIKKVLEDKRRRKIYSLNINFQNRFEQ